MKAFKQVFVLAVVAVALTFSGCSGFQKAQAAYRVVDGIVAVAEADLPALQAAGVVSANGAAVIESYLQVVKQLNGQYSSCITNAQNTTMATSGKFLACLNIFSSGLADPKELASLRVLNVREQKQIQLWVTAFQLGVNSTIAALGGQQEPAPSVASAPAATAELHALQARVMRGL